MVELAVDSAEGSPRLLAADEAPPWIVIESTKNSPFLLLGDHASRTVPRSLAALGLPDAEQRRHIAWDIGIAGLGAALAGILGAAFIAQRFSRLVIDANREPGRADAIPEMSDGTSPPGNAGLSPAARRARFEAISAPYHARIAQELDRRAAQGLATTLISLHSFTPVMGGFVRPWEFGVLHAGDSAFSQAALAELRASVGAELVGDNEPYRMDEVDYTIPFHCRPRGLDYLELEVRQDLLADPTAEQRMATKIAPILFAALANVPSPG